MGLLDDWRGAPAAAGGASLAGAAIGEGRAPRGLLDDPGVI